MERAKELRAAELYQNTDPGLFDFETTADVADMTRVVGQDRAVEAMKFGIGIQRDGYNIFALGPTGTGKRALVTQYFEQQAGQEPVPSDWCYVNNFDEAHKPKAIRLPPGKGAEFRQDMERLVEELRTALSAVGESEEYQTRRQGLMEEFQERQSQAFEALQQQAQEGGMALLRTPAGLALAPVRDGEILSPNEVQQLSEVERKNLETKVEALQGDLQKVLRQVPGWQREMRDRLKDLNREMAGFAIGDLIDEMRRKYSEYPQIVEHLEAMQKDVVENAEGLMATPDEGQPGNIMEAIRAATAQRGDGAAMRRYQVNLLVSHEEDEGAPVIYEDNPTYQNLIGRVEHQAQMGALVTDFNLIKAGALHRANGGYLVLDARKVLTQPYAWEGLKRALQAEKINIESVGQMLSLISTISLEPEPIPLDVKVALVGDRMLYYLLYQLDPDFSELFKVQADFEDQMDRTDEGQRAYARLIATLVHQEELRPFRRDAVARVIEHGARMVGDSERLSTHMRDITDLLREADYWADRQGNGAVTEEDVQQAIDAQIYRANRVEERSREAILRETLLIDTTGEKVGQVNGLSVAQLGNFAFGQPTRITARVRLGKGEVVDIEREVELGGPIHSKGVLILSGYLGSRYAGEKPLSLAASLVFEQSYGGVEGDSASSAELYALLSAISQVPIEQSFAVTGSVNQNGEVQAIGGVNYKIEGFFDVCKARGLTGDQGVLIPKSNVKHLMLRQDVVDAVAEGRFHIYSVETIDQGIEVLTGMPAGERDEEGNYPEGTINYLVEKRLDEMAERQLELARAARGRGEEEEEST